MGCTNNLRMAKLTRRSNQSDAESRTPKIFFKKKVLKITKYYVTIPRNWGVFKLSLF